MKKIITTITGVALMATVYSCNSSNSSEAATTTTTNEIVDEHAGHDHAPGEHTMTAEPMNMESSTGSSEALNPPHGQPGHRCDIPEGAPLSTPVQPMPQATEATAPQAQTAPVQMPAANQQMSMPAQQTAPGFAGKPNPEHGQPGHRCDMEVGAILP